MRLESYLQRAAEFGIGRGMLEKEFMPEHQGAMAYQKEAREWDTTQYARVRPPLDHRPPMEDLSSLPGGITERQKAILRMRRKQQEYYKSLTPAQRARISKQRAAAGRVNRKKSHH